MAKKVSGELIPADSRTANRLFAKLEQSRPGFWEHVLTAHEIIETRAYLTRGYGTVAEFMEAECSWKEAWGYRLIAAGKVRQSLSTIVENPPDAIDQLTELGKIDNEKDRQQVYARASEAAESEDRKVTTRDIRKASKPILEAQPADNGKDTASKPGQGGPQAATEPPKSAEKPDKVTCPTCRGKGEVSVKQAKRAKFTPPTRSEAEAHCNAKGFDLIDLDEWFNHYQANGWKVGRVPMTDWKATLAQWNARAKKKRKQTGAQYDATIQEMELIDDG